MEKGRRGDLAGRELVMAGYMALDGTAAMIRNFRGQLRGLPQELLENAVSVWERQRQLYAQLISEDISDVPQEKTLVYRIEGESLFRALWQIAGQWGTGFSVDLTCIPLRQETVEVCEVWGVNPYWLGSGGCLLIAGENGGKISRALRERGIAAQVIGELTVGRDKLLLHGQTKSCLNRPGPDELERIGADMPLYNI